MSKTNGINSMFITKLIITQNDKTNPSIEDQPQENTEAQPPVEEQVHKAYINGEEIHQPPSPMNLFALKSESLGSLVSSDYVPSSDHKSFKEVERVTTQVHVLANEVSSPQDRLHLGILNNSPEEIKQALNAGANINIGKDGKSPLLYAILLKKSNAVQELLNNRASANINYLGFSLVHHSIKNGDIKSAISLVKYGCDFSGYVDDIKRNVMDYASNYVESPPYPATRNDSLELIEELILHGYNINSSHWNTNVWYSAITYPGRTEEALKIFIKYGANPNQVIDSSQLITKSSWTPLLRAMLFHNKSAAKILLEAGADINQTANPYPHKGGGPHSPLSFVITFGYDEEMVQFLISNGATL